MLSNTQPPHWEHLFLTLMCVGGMQVRHSTYSMFPHWHNMFYAHFQTITVELLWFSSCNTDRILTIELLLTIKPSQDGAFLRKKPLNPYINLTSQQWQIPSHREEWDMELCWWRVSYTQNSCPKFFCLCA